MRDAFGGAFMLKMILVFIGIYVAFIAVAISYAKAFRVKNQIINYIEQYEGWDTEIDHDHIQPYLQKMSYYVNVSTGEACYASGLTDGCDVEDSPHGKLDHNMAACGERGYCIANRTEPGKGTYYIVTTFLQIQFPFFKQFGNRLSLTVPIRGETRVVTTGT